MPITKYKIHEDVKSVLVRSAYVVAPFDKGKEILEKKGYNIISLEQNAQLRMQEGPKSLVSKKGNWVLEDAIYIPNKGKFLTKVPIINEHAVEAIKANRNGKDFYLTDEQIERCLVDCVALDNNKIPTNRFNDNEITRYAFGKHAEQYGNFLKECGIKEMPIWLADTQEKPFARKVRFSKIAFDSRADLTFYWYLYSDYRVRGVIYGSAEGM